MRLRKSPFPESASELPAELRYCLVHIDCDLYAPVVSALHYFYPRLISGGVLDPWIMYDYSNICWDCAEQVTEEFFAKPEKLIPILDGVVLLREMAI